jgi:oligosaccharide repeat unit polymerase
MLGLVLIALFLLTVLNYYLGRSFFYPASIFCAAWTLALFCLLVSGNMFFTLSAETLAIFLCGAVAFSIGSGMGRFVPVPISRAPRREPRGVLTFIVTVFVLAFPFYLLWLFEVIADKPGILFLSSIREYFITVTPAEYTWKFTFFINILTSTFLIALIAWNAKNGHRKRAIIAAVVAALYSLLTGGRATTIQLVLSMLCIEWLINKKLRFKPLLATAACFALVFGVMGSLKNTGANDSISEKATAMSKEFVGYIGGPLVAFDRVVRQPNLIPHYPKASAFFVEAAAKLFPSIVVPPRVAEFVNTGPDRKDNVYTIYFSYFDTGFFVTCILLAIESFLLTIVYRFALAGGQTAIVIYAFLFGCIAFSTFEDFIAANVAILLRTYIACWMFYSFPFVATRVARRMHVAANDNVEPTFHGK